MNDGTSTGTLIREFVRLYVRNQRTHAGCGDAASTVQCHLMTELLREDGLTQQALVQRLSLDKSWISRATDALVAEGAIKKTINPVNRRSVNLSLTPAGRQRASILDGQLNQHGDHLLATASAEQQELVRTAMQVLLATVQQRTDSACTVVKKKTARKQTRLHLDRNKLSIQAANESDWSKIARLLQDLDLPIDGAQEHIHHFHLIYADDEMLGCAGLEVYGKYALLRSLAIKTEAQAQQCGKLLLQHMIDIALAAGVGHLFLLTTDADAYFHKQGFRKIETTKLPASLQASRQLQGACPASAIAMQLKIKKTN
ncbi:arsenic resistance N-acetyltransferase ArsN2 [Undibacterium sp. JH2W]|uniref:arsenic resistance N-acetyltransferase ArsN2 n=1 Tax=Undibacterium sp. JH2W TaxID=3413037 RepID=UPI003BF03190